MSTRDVVVRFSARTDAYVAAVNRARTATGALSRESVRNMATVGSSMQRLGRSATLGVTTPLVAVGGAAIHMSDRFQHAFSTMEGLANVPASEIDGLKESVLGLAGETGRAPQELAEALYFAASAGLDSAAAMDVLDKAARASAAGMGSTTDVVGLVAGAVAAYGPEVLSAAEATDILTAAIREGRADPTELAGALGRVTPIAAAMGISFGETAGAAAYMSNIMGNTDETITALRGVMLALLDPSVQGRKALESLGLTIDDVKNTIRQDGLVAAFELLRNAGLNPSSDAMSNLFEDNRALNGAMILLNDESGRLVPVIDAVTNSAGSLDEAFAAVSDDSGFKMRQAMAKVQAALIELGDILIPFAASVASSMADAASAFTDLPPEVQKIIVVVGGLIALGGPLMIFAGSVIKNFGLVMSTIGKIGGATGFAVRALGTVAIAASVAMIAWDILGEGHLNASTHINTASDALGREVINAYNAAVAAGMATTEVDALAIAHLALSNAIAAAAQEADSGLVGAMDTLNVSADAYLGTILQLGEVNIPMWENIKAIGLAERYFNLASGEGEIFLEVMYNGGASVEELANIVGATVPEVEAFSRALSLVSTYAMENKDEVDALALTYLDSVARMGGAGAAALELAEDLAGSRREAGNATDVYLEFMEQLMLLEPAEREAIMNTDAFATAIGQLPPELQAGMEGLQGFGYETEQMAMRQADAIDTMSKMAEEIENQNTVIGFYTDAIDSAFGPMQNLERARDDVRRSVYLFNDALDDESRSMDESTQAGLDNRAALMDAADSVLAFAQAQLESGMAIDDVSSDYEANIAWLRQTAIDAGLSEEAVDDLLETYGMTPETLNTAINLAGDALAKWRVDRYLEKLDEIPEGIASYIEALIDQGKYAEAMAWLEMIPDSQTYTVFLQTLGSINLPGLGSFGGWNAEGGAYNRPSLIGVGEAGPELVLPLSRPGRMASLLGMPGVGDRVQAAMPGGAGGMTTVSTSNITNVYVYNYGRRELGTRDLEIALVRAGIGGK